MREIKIRWVEDQVMVGTDSNQHSIVIGKTSGPDSGFIGVKPADLLLMAAASCSTWDIIEILNKQREPVEDIQVVCSADQQTDPPFTFKYIHLHYIINGNVNPDRIEKAIKLSLDKYCSVVSTLRLGIPVSSDWELVSNRVPVT